jgi:DNA-binding MarR family transcriptional regulator
MKDVERGGEDAHERTEASAASADAARRALCMKRPFRSRNQEAAISLLVAAERLRRSITRIVEPSGVTLQQYNVLRILRGAHPDPLPTLEIAARMIESTPGVTRLLDRLESKGWVRRDRCIEDRRQVHCRITPAGLALLAELDAAIDLVDDRIADVLDPQEIDSLVSLLDEVIEVYDDPPLP